MTSTIPRGLRNNNPGNLRLGSVVYNGEVRPSTDGAFRQFQAIEWGYRAMFVLLHTYRVRYGLDTLRKMIGRYAPPSENDTRAYIATVARQSGLDPDEQIDTLDGTTMQRIVAAIATLENGTPANHTDIAKGWELFV